MPTRGRVVVLSAVLALAGAACGSAQQSPSPSAAASASPLAPGPSPSLPPSVAATSPSPSPTAAPASQEPARSIAKVVADSPLVVRTRPGTDQYSAIIDWRLQLGLHGLHDALARDRLDGVLEARERTDVVGW